MIKSPSEKVQWKDAPQYAVNEPSSGSALLPDRLWRILQRDEYDLLSNAPMLEGNFVQVTKKGGNISILNHPTIITIGILATSPNLAFPDLMIIARGKLRKSDRSPAIKNLEISRLVSLELVELFVDNMEEHRIKVQMMGGQTYYLHLYAPGQDESLHFDRWLRLIYLIHLARGRLKRLPSFTFMEPGPNHGTAEGLPVKKHWLPAVMDQSSTGRLKEQLYQIHPSKESQSSEGSGNPSKQSLFNSDLAAPSSLPPMATSGGRPVFKGPSPYSTAAKKSQARQVGSSNVRKPEPKEKPKPRQMSPLLTSKRTLGSAKRLEGTRHSRAQVPTRAVAHSLPPHQTSAAGPSHVKNIKQSSVSKPGKVPITMTSPHSTHAHVKLQKSKKSRALTKSPETKRKKAAIKSLKRSPIPPKPQVPPTRHATASKTSSARQKKHTVSSTMPVTSPAPACPISVDAGPSGKKTVAGTTRPSEAGLVSTASSQAKSTTQRIQVVAEVHKSAERSIQPHQPMSRRPKDYSPKQGRSTTPNRAEEEKEENNLVALRRTMESVAVGASQVGYTSVAVGSSKPDNMATSRLQSRALGTEKLSRSGERSRTQKVKDKKDNQPSSKTMNQTKSRSKEDDSKSKMKLPLSSGRQRSSLTFTTLYSALSVSFDKMKKSMSKDDTKVLSRNPSKRVTISGVDVHSGKGVRLMEGVGENRPHSFLRIGANPVGQK